MRLFDFSAQEANTAAGLNAMCWDVTQSAVLTLNPNGGRDNKPTVSFQSGTFSEASIAPGSSRLIVGLRCALQHPVGTFAHQGLIILRQNTTTALCIGWRTDLGQFYIGSDTGGTNQTLIPGTFVVNSAVQRYVEFDITLALTAIGSIEARLDGAVLGALSAVRTHWGSGSTAINRVGLGSFNGYGGFTKLQDMYVNDSTGSANNGYEGDVKIDFQNVDANGDEVDGIPSAGSAYQCVDDGDPNDDTDYVSMTAVGDRSAFSLAPIAGPANAIKCVTAIARWKKDDAGVCDAKLGLRRSGNEVFGTAISLGTTYSVKRFNLPTDPNGGGVLDTTMVDSLQVIVERTA